MPFAVRKPADIPALAFTLKRLRLLRGMKQDHLADLLGVTQSTVSRWERGDLAWSDDHAEQARILLGTPAPGNDAMLRRLVESSTLEVHLICDLSHRLLAASPARQARWRVSPDDLHGTPLLRFASAEILVAEAELPALGWHDGALATLTIQTGANSSDDVPIRPGTLLWERSWLSDGSPVRLVTTVH